MKVEATAQFLKDIKTLNDKKLKLRALQTIEQLEQISSLKEIVNVKKLKGFRNTYRIRIGNFRIGFIIENETVVLGRCLERKNIYKFFP